MNLPRKARAGLKATAARLAGIFLTGLLALLPIFITIGLILWVFQAAESLLGGLLGVLLPRSLYLPGMGIALAIGVIFLVGAGMQGLFVRQFLGWLEEAIERIPLVKTVYGAVRDLTGLMGSKNGRKFDQVVMVQLPTLPIRLIGFVTVEDLAAVGIDGGEDAVAVYVPKSYQIGGYTLFIARRCLTPLDMSFEEAMRFVITAGLSRPGEGDEASGR